MTKYVWVTWSSVDYKKYPMRRGYREVHDLMDFPVDRHNILKGGLGIDTKNIVRPAVFSLTNIDNNFEERYYSILDQVAATVIDKVGDRELCLMYSGGVDSVVVLAALTRSPKFKDLVEQNKFSIALTASSVAEYPWLFYNVILPNYKLIPADYDAIMRDKTKMMLTGDLGDYVMSSPDAVGVLSPSFDLMSPPRQVFGQFLNKSVSTFNINKMYLQAAKRCPFDITTANQLLWWGNQCYNYHEDLLGPYKWSSVTDLSELTSQNKVFRFFYDERIVKYSYEYMSTRPVIHSFEDSRLYPKRYAVDCFGDESYMNKPKVYSQRKVYRRVFKSAIYHDGEAFKSTDDWNLLV